MYKYIVPIRENASINNSIVINIILNDVKSIIMKRNQIVKCK